MRNSLPFDFLVDRERNTITIRKAFGAGRQLVWDAYTKSELLDQWFAPKPFTTKTRSMDFREGGYWLYAMIEPNGTEYWGRMDYLSIQPIESYTAMDAFCNEQGEVNPQLPRANWVVSFTDLGEHARVDTVVTYGSLADLETVVQMGMQEGLTSTLERLDELLASLNP
ncbi:SRPBCC family protein [Taibaiella helva]|uniref:SRPBCC family protein n=1 Tax=Taibaiella helva TaxID=2301235 RepID=UPI000E590B13|nr:SRPBCC domain-containing protein [Taibaiella helva]